MLNSSNADLLLTMFRRKHQDSQLDYLRYNTFTLFAEYVFATFVFAIVVVFGQTGGLFSVLRNSLPVFIGDFGSKAWFFIVSMLFFLIVVRLKSFITNVYHFAVTGLVLKFAKLEREPDSTETERCDPPDALCSVENH